MKINKLFVQPVGSSHRPDFAQCFKPIFGLGTALGAAIGYYSQKETNEQNYQQFKESQSFTAAQNEQQRGFEATQNQLSRDWQTSERLAQQAFLEYMNDPNTQVKKLLNAGLNPAAVYGQAGSGGQIGSAPSAPSASNASASMMGAPSPIPMQAFNPASAFADLARGLESLSSAKFKDNTLQPTVDKLSNDAREALSRAKMEQANAAYSNALEAATKAKAPEEVKKLIADTALAVSKKDLTEAQEQLAKAEERLTYAKSGLVHESSPLIIQQLNAMVDLLKEQKRTEISKQASNYASASYNKSLAVTENAIRQGRLDAQELQNDILGIQKSIAHQDVVFVTETAVQRLEAYTKSLEQQDLINREMSERIRSLTAQGDWAQLQQILSAARSATEIVSSAYGMKLGAINAWSNKARADWQHEFNEIYRQSVNDKAGPNADAVRAYWSTRP